MDIRGRALLAPISTFTNLPFRLLCQKHGSQGATVPLVSAKAIIMHESPMSPAKRKRNAMELDPDPSERFVSVQLFGSMPDDIGKAASIVAKRFDFIKHIDINCACPVKKLVRTGAGSALLHKPDKVAKMIKATKECGIPVTVKLRKLPEDAATLEFCRVCEEAGAEALFVHGRLPGQGYSGIADWEITAAIAQHVSIPVIGSGDIHSMEQGRNAMQKSGCAGFMIGRAAMADPEVFSSPPLATLERKRSLFMEYVDLCREFKRVKLSDLKSKAIQIFSSFDDSASFRAKIGLTNSEEELMKCTID